MSALTPALSPRRGRIFRRLRSLTAGFHSSEWENRFVGLKTNVWLGDVRPRLTAKGHEITHQDKRAVVRGYEKAVYAKLK